MSIYYILEIMHLFLFCALILSGLVKKEVLVLVVFFSLTALYFSQYNRALHGG